MNCEEIKTCLHEFADETLDPNIKLEVEIHISNCSSCRKHYLSLIRLFDLIEEHRENIKPPSDLIENMYKELLARSQTPDPAEKNDKKKEKLLLEKEKYEQERKLRQTSAAARKSAITRRNLTQMIPDKLPAVQYPLKKILLIILPLVLLTVVYFVLDYMKYNSPWKIVAVSGRYFINGKPDNLNKLVTGKTVLTDNKSKVIVNVPLVGRLDVGSNTAFTLVKAKDGDNRINLKRGFVRVSSLSDIPFFAVEMNSVTVHDRGGVFSVGTDDFENTTVSVEVGNVAIEHDKNVLFLSEGYTTIINSKGMVGTPYRYDATDDFKNCVKQIDEGNYQPELIGTLVKEMRPGDVLTLFAVIPEVPKSLRSILFAAINEIYSPPPGVNESDILNADKDKLQAWWDEIEWQL